MEFASAESFESLFLSKRSPFQQGLRFADLTCIELAGKDPVRLSKLGAYPLLFKGHAQPPDVHNFTLVAKRQLSPNSWSLRFGLPLGERLTVHTSAPTGIKLVKPGTTIEKSYSPMSNPASTGFFDLLVKKYPLREGGGFGAYLCDMM